MLIGYLILVIGSLILGIIIMECFRVYKFSKDPAVTLRGELHKWIIITIVIGIFINIVLTIIGSILPVS